MSARTIRPPLAAVILPVLVLAFSLPGYAQQTVLALSTTLTFEDENGQRPLEVEVGDKLAVRGPSGAGFEFESDGTVGVLLNENIAVKSGDAGCFVVSVSDAMESDVFDIEIRGQEDRDYLGPSLDVTGSVGVELGADVEICLEITPGRLLKPSDPEVQRMAVAGFVERADAGWTVRTELSAKIMAGAEFSQTLEAYCADEDLAPPDDHVSFDALDEAFPQLSRFTEELGQSYEDIGDCVWAARALDTDFPNVFLSELLKDWSVPSRRRQQIDDCYEKTRAFRNWALCETAIFAVLGHEPSRNERFASVVLSEWIHAKRIEKFARCDLVVCDDDCRTNLRLSTEELSTLIAALEMGQAAMTPAQPIVQTNPAAKGMTR
ncbi:MAG: hypothetical protein AAFU81_15740 [Pseudomonadota bacterium]